MKNNKAKSNAYFILIGFALAISIYLLYYVLFGGLKQTLSNIIFALAYGPIGILYETFVINRLLEKREQIKSEKKINLIIGFFFLELGTDLISIVLKGDNNFRDPKSKLQVYDLFEKEKYDDLIQLFKRYNCNIDIRKIDINELEQKLDAKDNFMVELITNPIFEGDESFIEMVVMLLNMREALQSRDNDGNVVDIDKCVTTRNICESYYRLLEQWVRYIEGLRKYHPSSYAKAIIYSPFEATSKEEKDAKYKKLLIKYKCEERH